MDPVTMIAAAVAAGAAAGLTDTAKQAVVDAYRTLKGLITARYPSADVTAVEAGPEAPDRQLVLVEKLEQAGAAEDHELLSAAEFLLRVIDEQQPQAAAAVGIQLTRTRTGDLEVTELTVSGAGSGFVGEDLTVDGTMKFGGVHVEGQPPNPPRARR